MPDQKSSDDVKDNQIDSQMEISSSAARVEPMVEDNDDEDTGEVHIVGFSSAINLCVRSLIILFNIVG